MRACSKSVVLACEGASDCAICVLHSDFICVQSAMPLIVVDRLTGINRAVRSTTEREDACDDDHHVQHRLCLAHRRGPSSASLVQCEESKALNYSLAWLIPSEHVTCLHYKAKVLIGERQHRIKRSSRSRPTQSCKSCQSRNANL